MFQAEAWLLKAAAQGHPKARFFNPELFIYFVFHSHTTNGAATGFEMCACYRTPAPLVLEAKHVSDPGNMKNFKPSLNVYIYN